MMIKLIESCKNILDIRSPVRIEFKDRIYKNCVGVHWAMRFDNGKIHYHIIKISIPQIISDPDTNLETILAHEFIHAWQAEYRPIKKVCHTKGFIKKAGYLRSMLLNEGFHILSIYRPGTDTS